MSQVVDSLPAFTVMLSSPGDVRDRVLVVVVEAISEWNRLYSRPLGCRVEPWTWERDSAATAGKPAQETIFDYLGDQSDFCMAFFWTRLGGEPGVRTSGTVQEVEYHVEQSRPVGVFLCTSPATPAASKAEAAQLMALTEYVFRDDSMKTRFSTDDELRAAVLDYLTLVVEHLLKCETGQAAPPIDSPPAPRALPSPVLRARATDDDLTWEIEILNQAEVDIVVSIGHGPDNLDDPATLPVLIGSNELRVPCRGRCVARVMQVPPALPVLRYQLSWGVVGGDQASASGSLELVE